MSQAIKLPKQLGFVLLVKATDLWSGGGPPDREPPHAPGDQGNGGCEKEKVDGEDGHLGQHDHDEPGKYERSSEPEKERHPLTPLRVSWIVDPCGASAPR